MKFFRLVGDWRLDGDWKGVCGLCLGLGVLEMLSGWYPLYFNLPRGRGGEVKSSFFAPRIDVRV